MGEIMVIFWCVFGIGWFVLMTICMFKDDMELFGRAMIIMHICLVMVGVWHIRGDIAELRKEVGLFSGKVETSFVQEEVEDGT